MATPIAAPAAIAFIGLGTMGAPMAGHLAARGYDVRGWDVSAAARSASPVPVAASARAAVAGAVAVITMLPDAAAVRAALIDGDALADAAPGTLIIEMSSSDPLATRTLGGELAARGFALVDAPVSGGVKKAREATLAIMAGGEAVDVDRAMPVLAAMGASVFRCGGLGAGHAMKALNNYVSAAGLVAAVEALAIGARFGLDQESMVDVLNASTGRNNTTEHKLKQQVIPRTFAAGFAIGLMAKDVGAAASLARGMGVDAPLAQAMAERWAAAAKALGPGADHTAIAKLLEG
ncbi:NAD(P)-dependent oxidoreductase [Elioraea sp.]|uniref:NAD(P)-dependent oxidoreductase n=1 Tax=Elioraea sp. TaxID=2185103 RepID=UPI0025BFE7D1|nr:NAD(P)-dependent oxidoreductase [Elioraea sp.]